MRLLCLQLKRIGDAILTAPALSALREAHPLARITLVLHGPAGQLASAFSVVDDVLVYRPARPNLRLWGSIVAGRWDVCYDFTGTDRSAVMARMSRAGRVVGFRKFVEKRPWRTHGYTDLCDASVRDLHTADFCLALTGLDACDDPGLEIPESRKSRVDGLPQGGFVVVHPGTARPEKFWPADRWAAVIRDLEWPVVLTGGVDSAEMSHLNEILTLLPGSRPAVQNLAGRLTLLQLGAVIRDARAVLTVDSAAMHLAAALGRPQVALFGPTNPFHWRPRHPRAVTLVAGEQPAAFTPRQPPAPMTDLPVDRVREAVSRVLRSEESPARAE